MKKQFGKKLYLNKATVAHLNDSQLDDAKGGTRPTVTCGGATCPCYETYAYEHCPLTSNPAKYPGLCATEIDQCC